MTRTQRSDIAKHILELNCRQPIAQWQNARGNFRVEKLQPKNRSLGIREDMKLRRPYRLHWLRIRKGSIIYDRVSKDFATLDDLFEWAQEQNLTPKVVQMETGI